MMEKMGKVLLFSFLTYCFLFVSLVHGASLIARWDFDKDKEVMIHGFKIFKEGKKDAISTVPDPSKREDLIIIDLSEGDNKFYVRTYKTYEGIDGNITEYSEQSDIAELEILPKVTNFSVSRMINE